MDARELLLHIDACRPGGVDLQDAEMAPLAAAVARDPSARDLYERVQAADAKIGAAIRGTHAVPQGLVARLLAAVQEAPVQEAAVKGPAVPSSGQSAARTVVRAGMATTGSVTPAPPPARFSWRRAMVGTSLVAAVVALAVYVSNLPRPITADEVVEEVRQVYDEEIVQANDWQKQLTVRPDADFAFPVYAVNNGESFQAKAPWRSFTFWNSDAVAFDLYGNPDPARKDAIEEGINQGIIARRAVLFVIDRRVYGLPTAPPSVPQGRSVGPVIGVWRSEDVIYALAVEGRAGAAVEEKIDLYRRLLRDGDFARRAASDSQVAASR